VYGECTRGLMRDAGIPDDRMTTIANSLDYSRHQCLLAKIRLDPRALPETPAIRLRTAVGHAATV